MIPDGQLLFAVLSMVALVTSAVAVGRASLAKSTIDVLRQNNEALTERVDILETEKASDAKRITKLEAENETLRTMASSEAAVERVAERLAAVTAKQHAEVIALLNAGLTGVVGHQHTEGGSSA